MGRQCSVRLFARLRVGGTQSSRAWSVVGRLCACFALLNGARDISYIVVGMPAACGLAMMLGWRVVHGTTGYEETYSMMQAAEGLRRRRDGAKCLEHLVRMRPTVVDTRAYAEALGLM